MIYYICKTKLERAESEAKVMGRMKELLMGIEEVCGSCHEAKCEGCKMKVELDGKVVYVNGMTREITGVKDKSKERKTGEFILSCMQVCVMLLLLTGCAKAVEVINVEKLADAIYIAEGGAKASHAYGILQHYKTTSARQACINTINHSLRDWDKKSDFISFLGSRYCPVGCDNDVGTNKYWIKNVKYFYNN